VNHKALAVSVKAIQGVVGGGRQQVGRQVVMGDSR
jgi:hypothetical protein